MKKYFSTVLTVLMFGLFGWYFYNNQSELQIILEIDWIYLVLIPVAMLAMFFVEGIFIKVMLKAFDKDLSVGESFFVSTLSRIGNYLLPMRAGAAMRAAYLNRKFKFPYSQFLSTLYGYYIILFFMYALFGLITLGYKYFVGGEFYLLITLFFAALLLGMLFLMFIKIPFNKLPEFKNKFVNKILKFVKNIFEGWNIIVSKRRLLIDLILITSASIVISTVLFALEFGSLGMGINIWNILLYSCLSGVSLLVSITPGSIGLREAIFLATSESLNISNDQVLQLALVDRGIMFALLFVLGIGILLFMRKFNIKELLQDDRKDKKN